MSSTILSVNFAFADATTKVFSMGPFDVSSQAVSKFKERLQKFNTVDSESSKKFTNLSEILTSDNGAELSGIKSATITVSQSTRIYDAATYGG